MFDEGKIKDCFCLHYSVLVINNLHTLVVSSRISACYVGSGINRINHRDLILESILQG